MILTRLLTLRYYDLYRLRGEFSFVDDAVRLFKSTAIGSLLIVSAAFLYRGGFEYRAFSYARAVFVLDFVLAFSGIGIEVVPCDGPDLRAGGRDQLFRHWSSAAARVSLRIDEMRERICLATRAIGVVRTSRPDRAG